jgi:hypothetical protein
VYRARPIARAHYHVQSDCDRYDKQPSARTTMSCFAFFACFILHSNTQTYTCTFTVTYNPTATGA